MTEAEEQRQNDLNREEQRQNDLNREEVKLSNRLTRGEIDFSQWLFEMAEIDIVRRTGKTTLEHAREQGII